MAYKKILTIQDISCVGQCSLTVALPILSACGLETCILPSAVLSTHTAGFTGFTFRDLTDDMPDIQAHWQKENIKFKAIYTGYLGSVKQVGYVQNILDTMGDEGCVRVVDPAMADNGKLYSIFNDEYVAAMRGLCASADILIPNITEACFLADVDYRETYDESYINELLEKLAKLGAKTIVLTGVSYKADKTGVIVYENGNVRYYEHDKVSKGWDGACNRTATWGIFEHIATGKKFCYINTHLDHKGTEAQKEGMKLIVKKFKEYNPDGYPQFLTGDLNVKSDNVALDVLKGYMVNTRSAAPKDKTDNNRTHNGFSTSGGSIIDHIYCTKDMQVVEYHTITENYGTAEYVSDHYPVYAIIKM